MLEARILITQNKKSVKSATFLAILFLFQLFVRDIDEKPRLAE